MGLFEAIIASVIVINFIILTIYMIFHKNDSYTKEINIPEKLRIIVEKERPITSKNPLSKKDLEFLKKQDDDIEEDALQNFKDLNEQANKELNRMMYGEEDEK